MCVLRRFSCVHLFVNPWTLVLRAPLFMGFPMQEYWSELPFPSPGDLPEPGIEPTSLMSPTLACRFFTTDTTWEAHTMYSYIIYVNVLWHLVWCLPSSRTSCYEGSLVLHVYLFCCFSPLHCWYLCGHQ